MAALLAPLVIIYNSLLFNVVVANILSLALLASLSTIIAIALYTFPYRENRTKITQNTYLLYRTIDWMSWLMFSLSFLVIVMSLMLSFYLVLLPWIIFIIDSALKCTDFSIAEILKAADILSIVLHGCISIGIGIAFMWSNVKHKYRGLNKPLSERTHRHIYVYVPAYSNVYKILQVMAGLIIILALLLIIISLLLALWSSIILFNVDTLKGFEELAPKYSYQYSWCR